MTDTIDRNVAALIAAQPYFSERYELARRKLLTARTRKGALVFTDGAVCDARGCTCQEGINTICIHQLARRIFVYGS